MAKVDSHSVHVIYSLIMGAILGSLPLSCSRRSQAADPPAYPSIDRSAIPRADPSAVPALPGPTASPSPSFSPNTVPPRTSVPRTSSPRLRTPEMSPAGSEEEDDETDPFDFPGMPSSLVMTAMTASL